MEKEKTRTIRLSQTKLDIIAESLFEAENEIRICGDEKYVAQYEELATEIGDLLSSIYKQNRRKKKIWKMR